MSEYRIKNWEELQHFKDRTPPWVKLYRRLLDDLEWHQLSGDQAKCLVMLWLVASDDETKQGRLPSVDSLAFRLRMTENRVMSLLAGLSHWLIQDDINVISERYQDDTPETETETEKRREEAQLDAELFNHWKTTCNHPRSQLTAKRKKLLRNRLKEGYTHDDIAEAIMGCANTPFNQGKNDSGQVFMDWDLILRDAAHLDRYIANYNSQG